MDYFKFDLQLFGTEPGVNYANPATGGNDGAHGKHAIVLDTVKGHGVAEAENTEMNHSMPINDERYARWMAELQADLAALEG